MATLSADTPRVYELGNTSRHPIITNDIIYEGAAVGDNASGYARPLVAGDKFLGFARAKCDNTVTGPLAAAGANGALNVELLTRGEVLVSITSDALTDHGRAVYASDDDTFTFTAAGNSFIGFVKRFDATANYLVVAFDASLSGLAHTPLKASFTVGAQSGNGITVNVQVSYLTGQDVAEARNVAWYLSTDSAGQARVAPALGTDITIASGTDGVIIEDIADSAGTVTTETDGDADFALTHVATGADTVYLNLVMPDGRIYTSGAITFT